MKQKVGWYKFIGQKIRPIELGLFFKKLLNIKRQVFQLGDLKFFLDPVSNFGIRLMEDGYYEQQNSKAIKSILREGDVFIDLGANEGFFSILASKVVGENGRVISIEPQQRMWPVISKNILLNDCFNIQLIPFAVGEKNEDMEIILTPSTNTGSSTLVRNRRNTLWKKQTSKTVRLDFLINSLGLRTIRLIKIDIEGYEYLALKSCSNLLKEQVFESLLIEFHTDALKQFGTSIEEMVNELKNYGYFQSDDNKELFTRNPS